jgi:hypothetical protein
MTTPASILVMSVFSVSKGYLRAAEELAASDTGAAELGVSRACKRERFEGLLLEMPVRNTS